LVKVNIEDLQHGGVVLTKFIDPDDVIQSNDVIPTYDQANDELFQTILWWHTLL
jgi:hypothetical protein